MRHRLLADGGTLFLDEAGELALETQAMLLRVLEGQGFRRLGGGVELCPDVRVLAATHKDLAQARLDQTFRVEEPKGVALGHPPGQKYVAVVATVSEGRLQSYSASQDSDWERSEPATLAEGMLSAPVMAYDGDELCFVVMNQDHQLELWTGREGTWRRAETLDTGGKKALSTASLARYENAVHAVALVEGGDILHWSIGLAALKIASHGKLPIQSSLRPALSTDPVKSARDSDDEDTDPVEVSRLICLAFHGEHLRKATLRAISLRTSPTPTAFSTAASIPSFPGGKTASLFSATTPTSCSTRRPGSSAMRPTRTRRSPTTCGASKLPWPCPTSGSRCSRATATRSMPAPGTTPSTRSA